MLEDNGVGVGGKASVRQMLLFVEIRRADGRKKESQIFPWKYKHGRKIKIKRRRKKNKK